jgi:hypothetical protein
VVPRFHNLRGGRTITPLFSRVGSTLRVNRDTSGFLARNRSMLLDALLSSRGPRVGSFRSAPSSVARYARRNGARCDHQNGRRRARRRLSGRLGPESQLSSESSSSRFFVGRPLSTRSGSCCIRCCCYFSFHGREDARGILRWRGTPAAANK